MTSLFAYAEFDVVMATNGINRKLHTNIVRLSFLRGSLIFLSKCFFSSLVSIEIEMKYIRKTPDWSSASKWSCLKKAVLIYYVTVILILFSLEEGFHNQSP